ncbi:deoxyribose-phosphate aldolase [Pseudoroseomonas deserti]|uniref:Deoxyribose-phosphate aldolase n=1 Tax=Teichococcus deserti TaxID=1817963 RepID=A0A1V2H5F0_9PROT|nr:deoxyribose-phosphate aldolase [Pseudoroseomonas deserti]
MSEAQLANADLAKLIDHTLLKPEASAAELGRWAAEAREHGFCSVCVNPVHVKRVSDLLAGSGVKTCSVVGFPLGASTAAAKAHETAGAVADGADEIDMVINIGALRDGRLDEVQADIAAVRAACVGRVLKVIIETCLLTDDQKRTACALSVAAGADFVKTSTGFSSGGATEADIALMRGVVGAALGVKASGGVRTRAQAEAMIAAGASRIGASSGVALIGAAPATSGSY